MIEENKSVVVVGGSGFIGEHLLYSLLADANIHKILVLDLNKPNIVHDKLKYQKCDIRNKIDLPDAIGYSEIYHLAALCKEPGYEWAQYFETNYVGTKNICAFAINNSIKKIIFTSTMMVFKAGENRNSEEDATTPDSAYGISKLLAEEVLKGWKSSHTDHTLKIIRPGVVFGRNENGNFVRLYKALKKNLFTYTGRKETIKGSIYVKEVVRFMLYLSADKNERFTFNFVFPEPDSISSICETMCEVMQMKRFVPTIPFRLALMLGYLFEVINLLGIRNPIHHRRIEKLYYSTNLSADAALQSGYKFTYTLKSAIEDWKNDCGNKGLY